MAIFPASGIVPTINRPEVIKRTLESLLSQEWQAQEVIIVDASEDSQTYNLIGTFTDEFARRGCQLLWERAVIRGAAAQRKQAMTTASQPVIWFFDDDI